MPAPTDIRAVKALRALDEMRKEMESARGKVERMAVQATAITEGQRKLREALGKRLTKVGVKLTLIEGGVT